MLPLFHVWLPVVLVWLVWRLGYDRRALAVQIVVGTVPLAASRLLTPPNENVNWVHRWGGLTGWRPLVLSALADAA